MVRRSRKRGSRKIDTVPLPEKPVPRKNRGKKTRRRSTGTRAIGTWPTPEKKKALKRKFSSALVTYRKASTKLKDVSMRVVAVDRTSRQQLGGLATELKYSPIVKYTQGGKICIRRSIHPVRYNCFGY